MQEKLEKNICRSWNYGGLDATNELFVFFEIKTKHRIFVF